MRRSRLGGANRPDERHELLLTVAFGADDDSVACWRRLRPGLDLDVLDVGAQALLPLVDRRLEQLRIEDPDTARLRGIRRRTWYLNHLLIERLTPVLRAVEDRGARPLLTGSWELPLRYYDDLGLRRLAGLHLLIDPIHVDAAVAAVAALGWARPRAWTAHRIRFVGPHGDECVIYVRLFREFPARSGVEPRNPWDEIEEIRIGDRKHYAISPTHEFARICLDDSKGPNPVWVADALSVLAAGLIDWHALCSDAQVVGASLRLHAVCAYLAAVFGAQIPADFVSELRWSATSRRERLAEHLSGNAPEVATAFLRATAAEPFLRAVRSFPRFLESEWGADGPADLSRTAARKLRARLTRARSTSARRDPAA